MKSRVGAMVGAGLLIFSFLAGALSAQAGGKVVVYTPNQQEVNDEMAAAFEMATGIKCDVVRAGSGVLVKRVKAERNRPLGDVAVGLSKILMVDNMDLWEPYKIKDFAAYPANYKDPNGMWVGAIVQVVSFLYNTKLLPPGQAPKTWSDFLDPRWKDKVSFTSPDNAGSAYTQLSVMLSIWGDNDAGWKKVETFLKNAKVTQQSSFVYSGVVNGEFLAGITMEYAVYGLQKDGAPVENVYPSEGTVAYTEGAAVIKGAPNRENAHKFMDWVTSVDARKLELSRFLRRPAREDIDVSSLAPGMLPLAKINLLKPYDESYWTKKQTEVVERVKDILLRVK